VNSGLTSPVSFDFEKVRAACAEACGKIVERMIPQSPAQRGGDLRIPALAQ